MKENDDRFLLFWQQVTDEKKKGRRDIQKIEV
jgi:hypothetical protein